MKVCLAFLLLILSQGSSNIINFNLGASPSNGVPPFYHSKSQKVLPVKGLEIHGLKGLKRNIGNATSTPKIHNFDGLSTIKAFNPIVKEPTITDTIYTHYDLHDPTKSAFCTDMNCIEAPSTYIIDKMQDAFTPCVYHEPLLIETPDTKDNKDRINSLCLAPSSTPSKPQIVFLSRLNHLNELFTQHHSTEFDNKTRHHFTKSHLPLEHSLKTLKTSKGPIYLTIMPRPTHLKGVGNAFMVPTSIPVSSIHSSYSTNGNLYNLVYTDESKQTVRVQGNRGNKNRKESLLLNLGHQDDSLRTYFDETYGADHNISINYSPDDLKLSLSASTSLTGMYNRSLTVIIAQRTQLREKIAQMPHLRGGSVPSTALKNDKKEEVSASVNLASSPSFHQKESDILPAIKEVDVGGEADNEPVPAERAGEADNEHIPVEEAVEAEKELNLVEEEIKESNEEAKANSEKQSEKDAMDACYEGFEIVDSEPSEAESFCILTEVSQGEDGKAPQGEVDEAPKVGKENDYDVLDNHVSAVVEEDEVIA